MKTDALIARLAESPVPVEPLRRPWIRTAGWLAVSLVYVALVVAVMTARDDLLSVTGTARFWVEQSAALATAVLAAFAAFCSCVPGMDRRLLALPVLPLGVWLTSAGGDCLAKLIQEGPSSIVFAEDWLCLPAIAIVGAGPALLMVRMLRCGAPLSPALTMALGGLAAGGLGSFGLRLFHSEEASLMVLVWQIGSVVLFALLTGWLGRHAISWKRLIRQSHAAARFS